MKFKITRVSTGSGLLDDQPCEEAYRDTYTEVEVLNFDDPAEVYDHKGQPTDWWYGDGINHRVENGCIKRDYPGKAGWFIDVNSLEELMALEAKYGALVIEMDPSVANVPLIDIYDDYRE